MWLSGSIRKRIAMLAAAMLVACHSMALARAATEASGQVAMAAALESCHDPKRGDDAPGKNISQCEGACQATPASTFEAGVFTVADLPALTVSVPPLVARAGITRPVEAWTLHADPPSHAILHCCLRN